MKRAILWRLWTVDSERSYFEIKELTASDYGVTATNYRLVWDGERGQWMGAGAWPLSVIAKIERVESFNQAL